MCVCVCVSVCLCLCVCVCMRVCVTMCLSVCLSDCLTVYLSLSDFVSVFMCVHIRIIAQTRLSLINLHQTAPHPFKSPPPASTLPPPTVQILERKQHCDAMRVRANSEMQLGNHATGNPRCFTFPPHPKPTIFAHIKALINLISISNQKRFIFITSSFYVRLFVDKIGVCDVIDVRFGLYLYK